MIDRDIHRARALLVEGNALLRSVAAAQLRDLGVGKVTQTGRAQEARLLLEREPFEIVICSRELEGSQESGQNLLEELRRERLLPYSTVFMMVTSQVSYLQVVEAAEASLDGFLVRPYNTALLAERLGQARQRKRELAPVLQALDEGQPELALVHAIRRFQSQQPHWAYCGRLAAELLLRLDRPAQARQVFEKLALASGNATWARLGGARSLIALGDNGAARQLVQAVLDADAGSADAHDLLGRLLVDQCDFDSALGEYRRAAELTPGCLLRAQHAGALAFYQGQAADALQWLEHAVAMGVQSRLFDALSLLLLAMLHHDLGDAARVAAQGEQLRRFHERFPQSLRLRRFETAAAVLQALLRQQPTQAQEHLAELSATIGADDFDLESANVVLATWARMPAAQAAGHEAALERIALRFCTSKALAEVLMASARRTDLACDVVRRCQARISAWTQQAMECAMRGDPRGAVRQLLEAGRSTLNAKLLEMAAGIARRHAGDDPELQAGAAEAGALLGRSCAAVNHIAGIQRSGRSPGGLQLRGAGAAEPEAA